jgi:hypothetical protein
MAQNFTRSDAEGYDAIKITDIEPLSLATADQEIADFIRNNGTSTLKEQRPRSTSKRERVLRALDQHYGPLILGQFTVSRVELHLMKASVHGELLDIDNTNFRHPPQAFIDGLRLNPADVESRIRASGTVGNNTIPSLLFEVAILRSVDAPPLLDDAQPGHAQKLGRLLHAAQKLDVRDTRLPEHVPDWVNKQKSKVAHHMGIGLQAFGIYSGMMGITDAMKRGDRTEAVINAGAVVTELGSVIIERGLVKTAQELIENSARIYQGFSKTHFGLHLSRAAGLIAGVLTLPFDIYFAIKALNDASQSTGKQALDHYVAAGLNLSSAALTLILGTAAIAGFSSAGPLGIAAAVILIAGAQIYSAIRQVDDITDYVDLSFGEKYFTFKRALSNQEPWQDIQDRYITAVAKDQHTKMLITRAQKWLDGQLKDSIAAIVNGNVDASVKASQVFWFEWDDQGRESVGSKEIKVPLLEGGNDTIDARNGIPADLSGVVKGTEGESKATFWLLGGGKDTILGVEKQPNHFSYGTGSKHLTGGEKDDQFLFEGAVQALKSPAPSPPHNHLVGGGGENMLVFQGQLDSRDLTPHTGFEIDLENGRIRLLSEIDSTPSTTHTTLEGIENVETLAGASNIVQGSARANRIVSRGHDRIDAGAGDDAIYLMGTHASAAGGPGKDQYFISHKSGTVTISEDAREDSVIVMDWLFEAIEKWFVEGTSLVVTSPCGKDRELPERKLIIKNIYKTVGDKRLLQEQTLRFLTQDGFQLYPDFPEELEGFDDRNIEILILAKGTRPAPLILNRDIHDLPYNKHQHYFINRETPETLLKIAKADDNATHTIYIDCDSEELITAQAAYTIRADRQYANHNATVGNFTLQLDFKHKTIKFEDFISDGHFTYSNTAHSNYLTRSMKLKQALILTMRDGVSYRITPPPVKNHAYGDTPGTLQSDGRQMLKKRTGNYLFLTPEDSKATALEPFPQIIELPAPLQNTVIVLEGKGSTYHVKFETHSKLRISTPGALAKTSNASTWYLYTRFLDPSIKKLSENKLLIGHTIILLPEYKDDDTPVEDIYLVTASGTTYKVDLIFGQIYLHSTT